MARVILGADSGVNIPLDSLDFFSFKAYATDAYATSGVTEDIQLEWPEEFPGEPLGGYMEDIPLEWPENMPDEPPEQPPEESQPENASPFAPPEDTPGSLADNDSLPGGDPQMVSSGNYATPANGKAAEVENKESESEESKGQDNEQSGILDFGGDIPLKVTVYSEITAEDIQAQSAILTEVRDALNIIIVVVVLCIACYAVFLILKPLWWLIFY